MKFHLEEVICSVRRESALRFRICVLAFLYERLVTLSQGQRLEQNKNNLLEGDIVPSTRLIVLRTSAVCVREKPHRGQS